jgi:hypothetical protein
MVRLALMCAVALGFATNAATPFHVFNEKSSLLLFLRPDNPSRYIGYRIVEGDPITTAQPVEGYEVMPERVQAYPPPPIPSQAFPEFDIPRGTYSETWQAAYQDKTFTFRSGKDGTAYFRYVDKDGSRISLFKAVEDGIDAWMWLEPAHEMSGSFLVQQCLRYSGASNTDKRHRSAFVPELSEFDLWERGDMRSLSYILQSGSWTRVDPLVSFAKQTLVKQTWEYISTEKSDVRERFYTPAGVALAETAGVAVEGRRRIPNGLIARESADAKAISGMYWERTTEVAVHHPADCLHSVVDLGPTSAGKPRVVRGKIYWFKGTKEDLLAHWKRDFPR